MTTLSSSQRQVKAARPVTGACRWAVQPTDTHPGCLVISGVAYLVYENRHDGILLGYRLNKADGTAYDLPADLSGCDCPDATYRERPGGCKHRRSLRAALAALGE